MHGAWTFSAAGLLALAGIAAEIMGAIGTWWCYMRRSPLAPYGYVMSFTLACGGADTLAHAMVLDLLGAWMAVFLAPAGSVLLVVPPRPWQPKARLAVWICAVAAPGLFGLTVFVWEALAGTVPQWQRCATGLIALAVGGCLSCWLTQVFLHRLVWQQHDRDED